MEVTLPTRIGHGYKTPTLLNIEDLYKEPYCSHRRLRVFANKGLKCQYCDKVGVYLISAIDPHGGVHVDVYTEKFQLMTIDHVIPKSKGGDDSLENLVPCCNKCNTKKSNAPVDDFLQGRTQPKGNKKKRKAGQKAKVFGVILGHAAGMDVKRDVYIYSPNHNRWKQNGGLPSLPL